jgi:signal peptidase I
VSRRCERGSAAGVVGVVVLVVFLVGMAVVVAGLTFSVVVRGSSMEPTLHAEDRLEVDLLHRHDIDRFDLVEALEPGETRFGGGTRIVKRVIGLPGDRVAVEGGAQPRVLLKPAGSKATYVVDNPTWAGRTGSSVGPCCTADGRSGERRAWATVPSGSYWLIGDNWGGSTDSRVFGFVDDEAIQARLWFRILPRSRFGRLHTEARLVPVQP